MYRKIRLSVASTALPILEQQLHRVAQFRDLLVDHLLLPGAAWNSLLYDYKLMGQVKPLVLAQPKLAEVPFHVLLAFAFDLCNTARMQRLKPGQAELLRQHRESLLYQGKGFHLQGDSLHLQLPATTLALGLQARPTFEVAKVRVYRFTKDGHFYGTFVQAEPAQPAATAASVGLEQATPAAAGGSAVQARQATQPVKPPAPQATTKGYDLDTLRAKLRRAQAMAPAAETELQQLRRELARLGENQVRWFRYLAEHLRWQQRELATLKVELERRRALPWLN